MIKCLWLCSSCSLGGQDSTSFAVSFPVQYFGISPWSSLQSEHIWFLDAWPEGKVWHPEWELLSNAWSPWPGLRRDFISMGIKRSIRPDLPQPSQPMTPWSGMQMFQNYTTSQLFSQPRWVSSMPTCCFQSLSQQTHKCWRERGCLSVPGCPASLDLK